MSTIAAAEALGDVGEAPRLMGEDDAARQAQPQHERVLVRRDVEQAVEFVAEDVETLGEPPGLGIGRDLVPDIERVLLALGDFLGDQLAAGGYGAVLGLIMDRHRVGGIRVRRARRRLDCRAIRHNHAAFVGNRGNKPFQILLLFVSKAQIRRHFLAARRGNLFATGQRSCQMRRRFPTSRA